MVDLTTKERQAIQKALKRQPSEIELNMFAAEWSEHCSYKSSKKVLRMLPTKGKRVLLGPGFDAGVLAIDKDIVATIHIESHNHPSAIDPYGGAATGVGGILRDILAMNTRPIAVLDPLRFGDIRKSSQSRWLLKEVVHGISDYGNCVGIPTVGGEVEFDPSFEANCLVDVVSVGLGRKNKLTLAHAKNPGDIVVLVGGSTGRDGIHGASFASRVLTEKSEEDRPAVQIPDPFLKKLILDATLEAAATGYVTGLKDLGGGGLTCGLSELAEKGGTGMEIELDAVPLRENMQPLEILISESQERMLFVVSPKGLPTVLEIFSKYEVPHTVIGKVTDSGRLVVKRKKDIIVDIKADLLVKAPLRNLPKRKPSYLNSWKKQPELPKLTLEDLFPLLLSNLTIAAKNWIYRQYDQQVGNRTVVRPGGDAAVLRVDGSQKLLAINAACSSKHCYGDPFNGAAGSFAEACRNVLAVGAEPIAMVDHLQFGDPENPEVYWTFVESVRALASYGRALKIPCVGGKVSFYNEDKATRTAIKPSPVIAVLGLLEKQNQLTRNHFTEAGETIVAVGTTADELGGSEFLYELGIEGGIIPKVNLPQEKRLHAAFMASVKRGLVSAAHDVSAGGLAVAIPEMCFERNLGAIIELDHFPQTKTTPISLLTSESHGRFILSTRNPEKLLRTLKGVPAAVVGEVTSAPKLVVKRKTIHMIDLKRFKESYAASLPKIMEES